MSSHGAPRAPFPYPPAAVNSGTQNPAPLHPNAEALANAASQHVFPEVPAPKEGTEAVKDVIRDGVDDGSEAENEHEEEPIIGGTPLEDMTTPMVEHGGFFDSRTFRDKEKMESRTTSRTKPAFEVPADVPEDMVAEVPSHSEPKNKTGGPALKPRRDMGSVSLDPDLDTSVTKIPTK